MPKILSAALLVLIGMTPFASSTGQETKKQEIKPPTLEQANGDNFRKPGSPAEWKYWLTNMVSYHQFSPREIQWATGVEPEEQTRLIEKLKIPDTKSVDLPSDRILVLPYPGGRHPRTGFLDGALRPQRETKVSVFPPWANDDFREGHGRSYVVVDVPEAIWSNLGLTFLAHTHIPTYFDKQDQKIKKLEWDRLKPHQLRLHRRLPNDIEFISVVESKNDHVRMEMTLTNGTRKPLSDLRVQNCVMLKHAHGFQQQSNDNKRFIGPYVVCHDPTKRRWIITAWKPNHRPWANPPCPCLHSDPKFPDCEPEATVRVAGWLSFYEGTQIDDEVKRIEKLEWWN